MPSSKFKTTHYLADSVINELVGDLEEWPEEEVTSFASSGTATSTASTSSPDTSERMTLYYSISAVLNDIGTLHHSRNDHKTAMACYKESMEMQIKAERYKGSESQINDERHFPKKHLSALQQQENALIRETVTVNQLHASQIRLENETSMIGMSSIFTPIRMRGGGNGENPQHIIPMPAAAAGNNHGAHSSNDAPLITMFNIALLHQDLGNLVSASEALQTAAELISLTSSPEVISMVYTNAGYILYQRGKFQEAATRFNEALEYARKVYTLPFVIALLLNLARAQNASECHEAALSTWGEAEALWLHLDQTGLDHKPILHTSAPHYFDFSALNYIKACICHNLGACMEALNLYQQFMQESQSRFGKNHPRVAAALHGIGTLFTEHGDPHEAMRPLLRSLDIQKQCFGEEHAEVSKSLYATGRALQDQGEYRDALELYKKALAIERKVLSADHPLILTTLFSIVQVHQVRGELDDALTRCQDLMQSACDAFGPSHHFITYVLRQIGTIFQDMGKWTEANLAFTEAYKMHQDENQLHSEIRRAAGVVWLRKENHDAAAA